jgi:hypothetical protein
LRKVWIEKRIPEDWYKGIIVPNYKGDRKQHGNYRGITLLCQTFKIYERIFVNKMRVEIKGKLIEELYAFRKGKVTTDLISGIRQLIDKNWEHEKQLLIFIQERP